MVSCRTDAYCGSADFINENSFCSVLYCAVVCTRCCPFVCTLTRKPVSISFQIQIRLKGTQRSTEVNFILSLLKGDFFLYKGLVLWDFASMRHFNFYGGYSILLADLRCLKSVSQYSIMIIEIILHNSKDMGFSIVLHLSPIKG